MDNLDRWKGEAFYWEAVRLRDEQRKRLLNERSFNNVVSLVEYRKRKTLTKTSDDYHPAA